PGLMGGTNDAECRAVAGCCKAAGIAVGQDGRTLPDQRCAVSADSAADLEVFGFDADRFSFQQGADGVDIPVPIRLGNLLHPRYPPEQVDCGRAGPGKDLADVVELFEEGFVGVGDYIPCSQGYAHGCSNTYRRCSPDYHAAYRFGDSLKIAVFIIYLLCREPCLIDHDHFVVAPFNSSERHVLILYAEIGCLIYG